MFGCDWKADRWLAQASDGHTLQRTSRRLLQLQRTVKSTNLKSDFKINGEKLWHILKEQFRMFSSPG